MFRELNIFFTALSFFTRIPFPKWAKFQKEYQYEAVKYFSIAGLIIGGLSGLLFALCNWLLPFNISLILCMVFTTFLTGALHEDGFMDVCDGFGGGWTKERILEIMKDSLVGAYGISGIIFIIMTRFFGMQAISASLLPIVLIIAHSFSRTLAGSLVNSHVYARVENSKAKDYTHKLSTGNHLFLWLTGLLPIFLLQDIKYFLIIIPAFLAKYLLGRFFQKKIGGFTGDCIGATQQIVEIVIYLSFYIITMHI
ncbi:adenosylcobinamide-GDP ribazoletransferase [Ancylomarina sp. 16SWW S1-10-2]|uniref:adenosylcobinamide-GDP ribazoletransferase n=1 Tax=Ancylomarina sp. 16SWW S1-10-2 TaxID=2499681 RepID=UPI0012AE7D39|nr:adenosylcobinamide-GDP ribazoletransferase [Ancylomarina sp. 16SWW S1-10-2]MRT92741.1 adenosylcobinamide-GDP ribazoletransferase [Ancylomarina sp. 16SWW S1-10-2]